jgi:hypothetical protein
MRLMRSLEGAGEVPDDDTDRDPDPGYSILRERERGKLVYRTEPSYTIIVNDAR